MRHVHLTIQHFITILPLKDHLANLTIQTQTVLQNSTNLITAKNLKLVCDTLIIPYTYEYIHKPSTIIIKISVSPFTCFAQNT